MTSSRRIFRVSASAAVLVFAGGIFAAHSTGSAYPALPISITIATLLVVLPVLWDDPLTSIYLRYLSILIGFAVLYRLVPFILTAGLIGIDPHWYAVQVEEVRGIGHTESIDSPYYRVASLYIVFLSIITEVTGLDSEQAIYIMAAVAGISLPLFGAILAYRLAPRDHQNRAMIVSAGVLLVSGTAVRYAFWPVAQTYAVIIFTLTMIVIVRFRYPDPDLE